MRASSAESSDRIVTPVLRAHGCVAARRFAASLYCGLMLGDGGPRVVEFNVRFGDPETQVVLPLLEGSLAALLDGAAAGALDAGAIRRARRRRGGGGAGGRRVIRANREPAERSTDSTRSTRTDCRCSTPRPGARAASWVARGGRAAYVVARGASVAEARARGPTARSTDWAGGGWRCRRDIAAAPGQNDVRASGAPAPARKG